MIAEHLEESFDEETIHPMIIIGRDCRGHLLPVFQEIVLWALTVEFPGVVADVHEFIGRLYVHNCHR